MRIFDSLANLISGLGGARDKAASNVYMLAMMDPAQLEAAYRSDWIARKIVDIIPADMTREWRSWRADEGDIEKLEAAEKALGIRAKVRHANVLARLYGGAAIVMGDGSARPEDEFRVEGVRLGGLRYVHVFSRYELTAGEMDRDIESPWFGRPKHYDLPSANGSIRGRIHPSRVIPFVGAPLPDPMRSGEPWGDSVLQAMMDAIKQAASAPAHVAALLPEAKTDIISVPGLSETLATSEGTAMLQKRFGNAALMKSMFNVLLMDASSQGGEQGELWQQKRLTFGDFPKLIETFLQIAAGAADIPVTRLLGQSPAGMSATGESDIRNYYDHVGARQENELRPTMEPLDEALIRHALGDRPDGIHYEWESLWQMGAKEKAEVAKMTADTAMIYVNTALVPADVLAEGVKSRLIDDGTFPGIEAAYDEHGDDLVEEEDETALLGGEVEEEILPANVTRMQAAANDAAPRTLYVRRDVVNAAEITAWAKSQGMTDIVPDLHVTIIYSRTPLDWIKAGNANEYGGDGKDTLTISEGGPRAVEPLGNMAAVLLFASSQLAWRHADIIRAGAEHGFPDYQPHVSLTKTPVDLAGIEPYRGKIVLGPEVFEEVKAD